MIAFWQEFENEKDVSLTIKTYVDNFTPDKKREIGDNFKRIKKMLNLKAYPPVYLYRNLMDRHQIYRFHSTYDCFVSSHRGEGWGIPQMEAMLMGNPVISTNCGGIHEYLTDGKDALLVGWKQINLKANTRNKQWYTPDQNWADADVEDLRRKMRMVYEDRKLAKKIGTAGEKTVRKLFGLKPVGEVMKARLDEIMEGEL